MRFGEHAGEPVGGEGQARFGCGGSGDPRAVVDLDEDQSAALVVRAGTLRSTR
ncbi:hypothetical protein [Nocardia sp. NPDC049707]|uniref:hypothetical protein n=1 Tax=Nocardia sp. NPDC049707 TaxID=3154735 RepID=UPI00342D6758